MKRCGKGPVHFPGQHDYWIILHYNDVSSALKQQLLFSSKPAIGLYAVLLGAEPKDHNRARQVLSEFDVVSDLAIPLTENVIANLLGLGTGASL